ncbi:hypothetical protein GMRT_13290 [Giardia muris]|uniref:Uncharacterized protein n=1 Tax=Giardia muris TaxID=5742 RepID=A0A4Z1SKS1_GIAMU|nr:hypothetical protein GMRT_13290 [Giardia muris]|eukprot:TNJ26254.1 hypothetical protein GMRT_13290 [Giardia muris]
METQGSSDAASGSMGMGQTRPPRPGRVVVTHMPVAENAKQKSYLIPKATRDGYVLTFGKNSVPKPTATCIDGPLTKSQIESNFASSSLLARDHAFTTRFNLGEWTSQEAIDSITDLKAHLLNSEEEAMSTSISLDTTSRLVELKSEIERLIGLGEFDPLFSGDPGDPEAIPVKVDLHLDTTSDHLERSDPDQERTDPELLLPTSNPNRSSLTQSYGSGRKQHNIRILNRLRSITRDGTVPSKAQSLSRSRVTGAGQMGDVHEPELGSGAWHDLLDQQAVSELETFNMAFDTVLDILYQAQQDSKVENPSEKLVIFTKLCAQIPYLLNTLSRTRDYLIMRSIRFRTEFDALSYKVIELQQQVATKAEDVESLKRTVVEHQEQVDTLSTKFTLSEKECAKLIIEKEGLIRELTTIRQAYEVTREDVISMRLDVDQMQMERDDATGRVQKLTVAANRLRNIAENAVARAQAAEKQAIVEIKKRQEYETKATQAQDDVNLLEEKLKKQDMEYKSQVQDLSQELQQLKAILEEYEQSQKYNPVDTQKLIKRTLESGGIIRIMQYAAEAVEFLARPNTAHQIQTSCPDADPLELASLVYVLTSINDLPTLTQFLTILYKGKLQTVMKKTVAIQTLRYQYQDDIPRSVSQLKYKVSTTSQPKGSATQPPPDASVEPSDPFSAQERDPLPAPRGSVGKRSKQASPVHKRVSTGHSNDLGKDQEARESQSSIAISTANPDMVAEGINTDIVGIQSLDLQLMTVQCDRSAMSSAHQGDRSIGPEEEQMGIDVELQTEAPERVDTGVSMDQSDDQSQSRNHSRDHSQNQSQSQSRSRSQSQSQSQRQSQCQNRTQTEITTGGDDGIVEISNSQIIEQVIDGRTELSSTPLDFSDDRLQTPLESEYSIPASRLTSAGVVQMLPGSSKSAPLTGGERDLQTIISRGKSALGLPRAPSQSFLSEIVPPVQESSLDSQVLSNVRDGSILFPRTRLLELVDQEVQVTMEDLRVVDSGTSRAIQVSLPPTSGILRSRGAGYGATTPLSEPRSSSEASRVDEPIDYHSRPRDKRLDNIKIHTVSVLGGNTGTPTFPAQVRGTPSGGIRSTPNRLAFLSQASKARREATLGLNLSPPSSPPASMSVNLTSNQYAPSLAGTSQLRRAFQLCRSPTQKPEKPDIRALLTVATPTRGNKTRSLPSAVCFPKPSGLPLEPSVPGTQPPRHRFHTTRPSEDPAAMLRPFSENSMSERLSGLREHAPAEAPQWDQDYISKRVSLAPESAPNIMTYKPRLYVSEVMDTSAVWHAQQNNVSFQDQTEYKDPVTDNTTEPYSEPVKQPIAVSKDEGFLVRETTNRNSDVSVEKPHPHSHPPQSYDKESKDLSIDRIRSVEEGRNDELTLRQLEVPPRLVSGPLERAPLFPFQTETKITLPQSDTGTTPDTCPPPSEIIGFRRRGPVKPPVEQPIGPTIQRISIGYMAALNQPARLSATLVPRVRPFPMSRYPARTSTYATQLSLHQSQKYSEVNPGFFHDLMILQQFRPHNSHVQSSGSPPLYSEEPYASGKYVATALPIKMERRLLDEGETIKKLSKLTASQVQDTFGPDLLIVTSLGQQKQLQTTQIRIDVDLSLGRAPPIFPRHGNVYRTLAENDPLQLLPSTYFMLDSHADRIFAQYCINLSSPLSTPIGEEGVREQVALCAPCILSVRAKPHRDITQATPLQVVTFMQIERELANYSANPSVTPPPAMSAQMSAPSLIPRLGEEVAYVRLTAASVKCTLEGKGQPPRIFELIERETSHPLQLVTAGTHTYIRIPTKACCLKSLAWTLKLIRMLVSKRLGLSESYLVARRRDDNPHCGERMTLQPGKTEIEDHLQRAYEFSVVQGNLAREDAESLPQFLMYWSRHHYGVRSLISNFLWTMIANIVYYQYESSEVYLFARLLFGDVADDYFLLYLDLHRCLRQDETVDIRSSIVEYISSADLAPLLGKVFLNWDEARIQALAHQICEKQLEGGLVPVAGVMSFALSAYSSARKATYQATHAILLNCGDEAHCTESVTEPVFRTFCARVTPNWGSENVAAFFCAFSKIITGDEGTTRVMGVDSFVDLFVSAQFGLQIRITPELLEGNVTDDVRETVDTVAGIYQTLQQASDEVSKRLIWMDISFGAVQYVPLLRHIRDSLTIVGTDLTCYDYVHALSEMGRVLELFAQGLLDIDQKALIFLYDGAFTAVLSYFEERAASKLS